MNGDDTPVTRRELRKELAGFKAELLAEVPTKAEMRLEITTAMAYVVDTLGARIDSMREDIRQHSAAMREELSRDLGQQLAATRAELSRELAGHVRAAAEENRRWIDGLDDRYRDLPGRVSVLERDLDEHRRDSALHPRRRR